MADHIDFYYDYLCDDSYAAMRWLDDVRLSGRDPIVTWRAFLLKEINLPPGEKSYLEDDAPDTFSLLALELAKACAAGADRVFDRYHRSMFDLTIRRRGRPTPTDALDTAAAAGLDIDEFLRERPRGVWRRAVAADYEEARERWNAFGSSTLVFDRSKPVYLKLGSTPVNLIRAREVYDAVVGMVRRCPEVFELKRTLNA